MRVDLSTPLNVTLEFGVKNTDDSQIIDLQHAWGYAIFVKWTKVSGTVAGSVTFQKSLDGKTWKDIQAATAVGDASGSVELEKTDVTYAYLKIVPALTGGKATFEATSYTKGA